MTSLCITFNMIFVMNSLVCCSRVVVMSVNSFNHGSVKEAARFHSKFAKL